MQEPRLRYRAMRCEKTENEPPNLGLKIMFLLLKKLSFQKPIMSSMFSFGRVVLGGLLILTVSGSQAIFLHKMGETWIWPPPCNSGK